MNDTTPTPEPTDVEALLAKAQDDHWACPSLWNKRDAAWEFACGAVVRPEPGNGFTATFRAHIAAAQAAALGPWVAQQRADALREAAEEDTEDGGAWDVLALYTDDVSHSYALAGIRRWLRARADRTAPTTEAGQR